MKDLARVEEQKPLAAFDLHEEVWRAVKVTRRIHTAIAAPQLACLEAASARERARSHTTLTDGRSTVHGALYTKLCTQGAL